MLTIDRGRPNAGTSGLAVCVLSLLLSGCPRTSLWLGSLEAADAGSLARTDSGYPPIPDDDQAMNSPAVVTQAGLDAGAPSMVGLQPMAADPPGHPDDAGTSAALADAGNASAADADGSAMKAADGSGLNDAGATSVPDAASAAMGGGEPRLPAPTAPCPKLGTGIVEIVGVDVQLWVGPTIASLRGPVVIYWYGTGSSPQEVSSLYQFMVDQVVGRGGVVAAPVESTRLGKSTGPDTWYTGDFAVADEIVACAAEQLQIDARRIYVMGGSAGALQAGAMLFERSSYLAAAALNSGGLIDEYMLQDPAHVPAAMTMHGPTGTDVVIVDFARASLKLADEVKALHGFAVDCDHGGGHMAAPEDLRRASWTFLFEHPFGIGDEPYAAGLPASFPSYCKIH